MEKVALFLLTIYSCSFPWTEGSVILFDSTPDQIKDGLTGTLTLRCALNDTAASASIVGRRDVTSTTENVEEVSSLIVMRNGVDIASVSHTYPNGLVVNGATNLVVTGDVTGHKGYIELTFTHPDMSDSGEFVCEVNAIGHVGHGVVFTTSLEVGFGTPNISDLASYMRQMESKCDCVKESNNQRFEQLEAEKELLKSRVAELEHSESGFVECGHSNSWTGRIGTIDNLPFHSTDITKVFKMPYSQPPIVKLGVVEMDHTSNKNIRYVASLVNVTTSGFTMRCATWSDSFVYRLGVSWISVAS